MVTWPDFRTNWKPSAASGAARSLPGVHDVPCPHPWLGSGTPPSALDEPDEEPPPSSPAPLLEAPLDEPLLEPVPELPDEDVEPLLPPLELWPPPLPEDALDPPELLLWFSLPLKPVPVPELAALQPATPSDSANADTSDQRAHDPALEPDTAPLRFMTTPRSGE